ncbi:hypothetical protein CORC01_05962 [Colletotrichum orchidophilum]|uniref:N-acetyltransferase domain-containing protein n=1 Tax=Colletotrichum orchidophilum TaxID=1209926 RepID=A0A1G4BBI1_9PEZI|nr:uncharacterized protein CORC01_05962 [Colletotrichum orchidophilum]OHE98696.1 hypothetical protein CORC01_05962 [Colletotrichum orchidophilum]
MSARKEPTSQEKQTGNNENQSSRDAEYRGEHTPRLGSHFSWSSIGLHPQELGSARFTFPSTNLTPREGNTDQKVQSRAPSLRIPSTKLTEPIKRCTSIRWARDLPVPDRRPPLPSFLNEPTASLEARRINFQFNNRSTLGKDIFITGPGSADYDYLAEKRIYRARKNFERTRKKREARIASQRLKAQSDGDDDDDGNHMMTSPLPLPSDYVPPHKRSAKAKAEDPVVETQEQPTTTSYYAESDTESSDDYADSSVLLSEVFGELAPLTTTALEDLPERLGVISKSKKSHSSWEVSLDDENSSSGGAGSSQDSEDLNEDSVPDSIIKASPWFLAWLQTLDGEFVTSFLAENQDHHNHDVDPATGQLLPRIEQPTTVANIEDGQDMTSAMIHRRRDWTSNLVIHREITVRKNMARRQQKEKEERTSQSAVQAQEKKEKREIADATTTSVASTSDGNNLLADCVLRPGQPTDAEACAEIYNLAVGKDHLVIDTYPVSAQRFEYIMGECKRQKLPFIVATAKKTELNDPKNWPSRDAYRQYMKWKKSHSQEELAPETTIYGFAYLRPYETGIGGLTGNATPTVKATIFVHPEHRRGGIGSALLHQLLSQTSILYHGYVKCKWADPDANEDAFHKPDFRDIHRIVVHTMAQSEGGHSLKWMENFVASFQFEQAGHLSQVYKVTHSHGAEWYDQVIWQHWAKKISPKTFYLGDESECSYDYPGKSHSLGARRVESPVPRKDHQHSDGYDSDDIFRG